jgi:peptidyl-prolyl cis-trans isomerase SurA
LAQSHPAAPQSPYGGTTVEEIVARVNDQIITRSDYDRAMTELDSEARQKGASMQEISAAHKDLLRNQIDQQLWISKGKELGITGETELVNRLNEIRKQYNLETMEDLEKAAKDQGVSFEDFKANIRNQIVTQQVMREQVGRRVSVTPGEVQRYYEAHKQEYAQPENVHLAEILVSTSAPGADPNAPEDPQRLSSAKAKVDDIEAQLKAGGDFDKLARASSDGTTASQGGDLGKFERGKLAKVFEDNTFTLKTGQFTEPIRTKQGYVILKVVEHVQGGVPPFKDVEPQVEETFYMSRMEPAMRAYLTTMREEAYIDIKPGYVDTGASAKETKPVYSSYTPPAQKKKKKTQRTRFRETERSFRKKPAQAALVPVSADTTPAKATAAAQPAASSSKSKAAPATLKAGKKEKIRYGQAPRETLPNTAETKVEDAGALPKVAENTTDEPDNPLQPSAPEKKTRFAARSKLPKAPKPKGPQLDSFTPAPPDATEVADRQTQSTPLGLEGDTKKKNKKKTSSATTGEKTRMQERPKAPTDTAPLEATPAAPAKGAPAPATAPKPNPTTQSTPGTSAPQQTPTSPDPPQTDTPASEPPH